VGRNKLQTLYDDLTPDQLLQLEDLQPRLVWRRWHAALAPEAWMILFWLRHAHASTPATIFSVRSVPHPSVRPREKRGPRTTHPAGLRGSGRSFAAGPCP